MSTVVGGVRARLIKDNLFNMVKSHLTSLGWFNTGRQHRPFSMVAEEFDTDTEIPMNTLVLADADIVSTEWEMGSLMAEDRWTFYFDFYAENDAIGLHLIQDVKAILEGRFASLGQIGPSFPIYDYRMATPAVIFYAEVENIDLAKAQNFPKPFQRHWYALRFEIIDYVTDDL
jgi:hypothetical protein